MTLRLVFKIAWPGTVEDMVVGGYVWWWAVVFDTAGLAIAATSSTCLSRADIVVMVRLDLYCGEHRTEADHDACLRATLAVAVVDKEDRKSVV